MRKIVFYLFFALISAGLSRSSAQEGVRGNAVPPTYERKEMKTNPLPP